MRKVVPVLDLFFLFAALTAVLPLAILNFLRVIDALTVGGVVSAPAGQAVGVAETAAAGADCTWPARSRATVKNAYVLPNSPAYLALVAAVSDSAIRAAPVPSAT